MSAVPFDCPSCGRTHPKGCTAHRSSDGAPCGGLRVDGLTVCVAHGGKTAKARAKAQRARDEQAAQREVARLGIKVEVHPAVALLDLVHWTAGEVAYWRDIVVQIEQADTDVDGDGGYRNLTWGVTKVKDGGDDRGTTTAAAPHVAYTMLERASDRLAAYASAALKAGVDERRVQLAEKQGALVADVIRAVLDRLHLTDDQWALVPTVVPEQLRLLTATKEIPGR